VEKGLTPLGGRVRSAKFAGVIAEGRTVTHLMKERVSGQRGGRRGKKEKRERKGKEKKGECAGSVGHWERRVRSEERGGGRKEGK